METYQRIEPTPGRLLVSPIGEEETMRGGLHIPASAQEKPVQGTIRAIGPDTTPMGVAASAADWSQRQAGGKQGQLKVDQRILFGKFAGTEIVVDGEDFLILGAADVLAIIHPKPAE